MAKLQIMADAGHVEGQAVSSAPTGDWDPAMAAGGQTKDAATPAPPEGHFRAVGPEDVADIADGTESPDLTQQMP